MAWCIDNVDAGFAPGDGGAFRQDGDTALALLIVRVHDPFDDLLVLAELPALLQQRIDERCLAMVDMGDDGDIADFHEGFLARVSKGRAAAPRWPPSNRLAQENPAPEGEVAIRRGLLLFYEVSVRVRNSAA